MSDELNNKINELLLGEEFEHLTELMSLGAQAVPRLSEILSEDTNPMLRTRAAIALGRISDQEQADTATRTVSVNPLTEALADQEPIVVISAIEALAKIGQKETAEAIAKNLPSSDPSVRRAAAKALGELGDESVVPMLEEISENDEFDFVRQASLDALSKIGVSP